MGGETDVLVWNPFGLAGLLAGLFSLGAAAIVLWARPELAENRRLALVLAVGGLKVGAGQGLLYLAASETAAYALQAISVAALLALPWLYFRLLAILETPLVRPLASATVDRLLLAAGFAAPILGLVTIDAFVEGMAPVWYAPWECRCGDAFMAATLGLGLVGLFGLVASLDAWRRRPVGSPARERAGVFAAAFGVFAAVAAVTGLLVNLPGYVGGGDRAADLAVALVPPVGTTVGLGLLAYGVLRLQMLDLDLRLKGTIRHSTVVGIFVGRP